MPDTECVAQLLDRARGPMGPEVEVDFGVPQPAWQQLGRMVSALNGFFVFDAGIQVFRVGDEGWGPEMGLWNTPEPWKYSYAGLADDLFCFAQDVVGNQFALDPSGAVVRFDAEDGSRTLLGPSLEDWAQWLLADPEANGTGDLALAWQQANRALEPDERLIPRQLFVLGGDYALENLKVEDSAAAMRIRGPIAQQVHDVPDGTTITLTID